MVVVSVTTRGSLGSLGSLNLFTVVSFREQPKRENK